MCLSPIFFPSNDETQEFVNGKRNQIIEWNGNPATLCMEMRPISLSRNTAVSKCKFVTYLPLET